MCMYDRRKPTGSEQLLPFEKIFFKTFSRVSGGKLYSLFWSNGEYVPGKLHFHTPRPFCELEGMYFWLEHPSPEIVDVLTKSSRPGVEHVNLPVLVGDILEIGTWCCTPSGVTSMLYVLTPDDVALLTTDHMPLSISHDNVNIHEFCL